MVGCDSDSNKITEDDDHAKLLLAAKMWRKNKNLSDSKRDDL